MKKYIGGVKLDQNIPLFKRICSRCKEEFFCNKGCTLGSRISVEDGCWCGNCVNRKGPSFYSENSPEWCKSRFPDGKPK